MDLLKVAALGLGAYLIYSYYESTVASATITPAVPATTTTTPPASVQASSIAAAGATNTSGQIVIGNNVFPVGTLMTVSQWNWYARQANSSAPIIAGGTGDNNQPVSYAQYQAYFGQAGVDISLNGLGRGMGMIVDLPNIFKGIPSSKGGFGEPEFAAIGRGLGALVDDPNNSAGYIDEGPMNEAAMFNGSVDNTTTDFYLAAKGQGT